MIVALSLTIKTDITLEIVKNSSTILQENQDLTGPGFSVEGEISGTINTVESSSPSHVN